MNSRFQESYSVDVHRSFPESSVIFLIPEIKNNLWNFRVWDNWKHPHYCAEVNVWKKRMGACSCQEQKTDGSIFRKIQLFIYGFR